MIGNYGSVLREHRNGKIGRLELELMEYWKIGILEEWVDNV